MENFESHEKLDARWYSRFEAVNFEDYEKLTGSKEAREKTKSDFLSGEIENPALDYPELESFDLDEREAELLSLKEDVIELEQNEAVKKIYRTKINELLATLRMLRATKNRDDRKFSRYADFIYGKPEVGDVGYVIEHVKELSDNNRDNEDQEKRDAAQRLSEIFRDVSVEAGDGVDKSVLPDGQDIPGKLESVDEAVQAFEEALQEIGATDWKVEVDDPAFEVKDFGEFVIISDTSKGLSDFSVSQEHKVVRIPSQEKLLAKDVSIKKLKGLIEHEIKTHVARRSNGERSKLQLLGLGLDRYLKAEEGIATYAEQQVTGATEFAGVRFFLSIVLAKGITGEKLDFRRTFEIMKDYNLIAPPRDGKEVTSEWATQEAYTDCVRIFRGTTCKTPGAVYPKDMSYFGNRVIWTLVSENSDVVETFAVGKYDPNNTEHVALLTQLGILDSDLKQLENEE